jgi:hypothetical protein
MGTIVGTFFSERTMESLKRDRERKRKMIIEEKQKFKEYQKMIGEIFKKFN